MNKEELEVRVDEVIEDVVIDENNPMQQEEGEQEVVKEVE